MFPRNLVFIPSSITVAPPSWTRNESPYAITNTPVTANMTEPSLSFVAFSPKNLIDNR